MKVIPDEEEVAIDDVYLATKSPKIVDWKIHKEGKKSYYQIVRADGNTFLDDAVYVDLHAGRKEISSYTTYNYRYAEQEASVSTASVKLLLLVHISVEGVNAAGEEVSTVELVSTAYVIYMSYLCKRYV
ncbi:hypothetical protein Tco_0779813 [Tanacetum coccineum]